jgi:adenylate kinase
MDSKSNETAENQNIEAVGQCHNCGKYFDTKRSSHVKYCSDACAESYTLCKNCRRPFPVEKGGFYCSPACHEQFRMVHKNGRSVIVPIRQKRRNSKVLKKLVFLGAPGAGKGTLAVQAQQHLHLIHISTGDIFRSNIKNKTALGRQVEAILAEGGLVPDSLTNDLVADRLKAPDTAEGFILDGYPRTLNQAEALDAITGLNAVINFVVDEETVIKRLAGRRVCRNCGTVYHIETLPPKTEGQCDRCGGELYIRDDDQPEAIKHRLAVYKESTEPLIAYYEKKGLLVNLDAGRESHEVWQNFIALIEAPVS